MKLEDLVKSTTEYQQIETGIKPNTRQLVTSVTGSARTLLLTSLLEDQKKAQIIVTDSLFHMQELAQDLMNRLPEERVFEFPAEELVAAEVATSSPNYRLQRVEALHALQSGEACVVVTSVSGLRKKLPQPQTFADAAFEINLDTEVNTTEMRVQLSAMGYQYQKMVVSPGDFAIRGSIIDIYPLNMDNPVRIDLFDTEVDSLRTFEVDSQKSIENIKTVTILPATDFIAIPADFAEIKGKMEAALAKETKKIDSQNDQERVRGQIQPLIDQLGDNHLLPEMMEFVNFVYDQPASLLDYLSDDGLVVADDYQRLLETQKQLEADEANWITGQMEQHTLFSADSLGHEIEGLIRREHHPQIFFALFQKGMGKIRFTQLTNFPMRNMQQFFGQMPLLKTEMQRWHKQHATIVIMIADDKRVEKVENTLTDFDMDVVISEPGEIKENVTQIINAGLQNGFELPSADLVVITESEMFKKVTKRKVRHQTLENAERIKSYTDLNPGDYVVHVNHGIGQFKGIQTMEVDGINQDYMVIDYQKNAQIFVPVTQLNLVQKYVSSEAKTPHVNKLGGTEWAKTKHRVQEKIEDIADELVELYAQRAAQKGFAFPKDDSYQEDFENDFPYSETPDQLRSSEEIKHDMERAKPMDRLLVGDVGYGKTEVALRAAFKAIEAGKQVAFLVPTTILAQQHYDTMVARFDGYPVEIGMMSRFRTTKQIHQTEKELQNGDLDIVVGTHRLLSKDIKFHDLGLLIIDEEQRFGVKHKERLKQIKSNVDVLTLTATPIPRTLHMSMLGVRDLSVIETPPAGRFPIQTYVMEQNAGALRDGIMRELQRGGQVYYLHNRVADIERTVSEIAMLVPEARVGYIHGQMTEAQLEGVLYDFVRGEYDVLVTTSIIETGVDISNVNTLFVENADQMGLSQLYQIRGRIGRSNRVAYAYFMYQQNKVLTEVSEKRLAAIRDFTELGSGFKIAMRDLSIRGAGNLLGKQQHGFIDSVGYDLYSQMLADAVKKKRGEAVVEKSDAELDLGVEAYLPSEYIEDQRQKIEMYKDIRRIENVDELMQIQGDLIDRYGDYPQPVANLIEVGKVKFYADLALIEKIKHQKDQLYIYLSAEATAKLDMRQILKSLSLTKFKATVNPVDDKTVIRLVIQPKMTQDDWLEQLTTFLADLAKQLTPGESNEKDTTTA